MSLTPWYPGSIKPVRSGWYLRDYSNVFGSWVLHVQFDLFLYDPATGGTWYVVQNNKLGDEFYDSLPRLPWQGFAEPVSNAYHLEDK